MDGIIVEKKVVVKAIDQLTTPLARMNERMTQLEEKVNQFNQKMSTGASSQQAFKTSLNEIKASASETDTALGKINRTIDRIPTNKKVDVKADTEEAKQKTSSFDESLKQLRRDAPKIKPTVDTNEANEHLSLLQRNLEATRRLGGRLKDFIAGNLIANGISNATSAVKSFAEQGFQAALAGQETAERWSKLGMTKSEIASTGAAVRDLKENTNMSGVAAGNLVTRFYGLTGSAARAQALAKGVGSITDSLKLSNQASDAFANGLARIEASGKVTSQSLGRLEKQAPGLTAALQKASGMSKQSFDDLLSSGKMTSDQFNQILERASRSYKKNANEWKDSTEGALKNIKQTWADSWQAMMAPLTQSSASGLGALSKSLSALKPEFTELGEAVANLATKFAKWLTPQHARDLGEIVGSFGRMAVVLGKGVWKAVTAPLEIIGKTINLLSGKHGDALDAVATFLDHISKNKVAMTVLEGIGMTLATQFAYSKLFKSAEALGLVEKGILSIGKMKFTGHFISDLTRGIKGLTKIRINPAKWFKGHKFSFKNLFRGASKEASSAGEKAGGGFMSRFASKLGGSRLLSIGKGLGGKLVSGLNIAIGAIDILRALTGSHIHNRAKMAGKGIGTILGGAIGTALGGPIGGAIGGMLGGAIGGKAGPALSKMFKGSMDFFKKLLKGDWSGAFGGIAKGFQKMWKGVTNWAKDTWKKVKDWWNNDDESSSSSSHKSSSHKSKQPSEKEIKSLGGNHYSRTDIANIKEMNRAITTYTRSLKSLKEVVKHNDPTKSLNSMNKNLKNFIKQMLKSEKPLEKVSKTFKNFGKATKTIADSMKNLTGKHGLGEFDKDLTKLDKDTKHSKIGEYFERLAKSIKKSKLTDQFKNLTKYLNSMVKDWEHLTKPMKQAEKEFSSFEKTIGKLANKKTGLSKVDSDIKTLSKDLVKYNFGKTLDRQMSQASKSLSGRNSITKQFDSMVRTIERDLQSFRKSFDRDWGSLWSRLSREPSRELTRVVNTANSRFSELHSSEDRFTSRFLSSWKGWLDDVVSAFRSGFNKLPDIAQRSMSNIVGRLNKGISAINSVISQFGGDKQLSQISYARGTFAPHPGGKALLNDGLTANKTELLWQPSKGWGTVSGQNRVYDLEAGSMVLDAEHSAPILGRYGSMIPHYAGGTLSDDEMDKIAEGFMDNPTQASKELMLRVTDWNSSIPLIPSFGKATAIGFSRGIANVLKDLLGIIKEPINGDWTPVIKSAFRVLHLHAQGWQIAKLLRQIQTESGGREVITNNWDSNAAAGHPSQGLLQFVPSTFYTWADPRYRDINKGFDQLVAAVRCLNAGGEGGWGNIGNGHGWASGGHITSPDLAWIGDNAEHDEYVINPYRDSAIPLLNQAWDKVRMRRPDLIDNQGTVASSELISLVKTAVDKLDNINIHPRVYVDDVRRPVNNRNAMDYARVMN